MCLGKSAADKPQALRTVNGDNAVITAAQYDWYNHFKTGLELLEDEPCNGRHSASIHSEAVLKVKELAHANWWITITDVANEVHVLCGSVKALLIEELWLRQLCSKFVLQVLMVKGNAARLTASECVKSQCRISAS